MGDLITIESVKTRSYRIELQGIHAGEKSTFFELILIDKERNLYQLIPEKESPYEMPALEFAHICCELFSLHDLEISSLYYTFFYHDGTTMNHTISRVIPNDVENYYAQILRNSQVLLVNPSKVTK